MKKQPEDITVCNLECVLMPQGEIISMGKTLGWFKDFKKHLEPVDQSAVLDGIRKAVARGCKPGLSLAHAEVLFRSLAAQLRKVGK